MNAELVSPNMSTQHERDLQERLHLQVMASMSDHDYQEAIDKLTEKIHTRALRDWFEHGVES